VAGWSTANGGAVIQWPCTGGANQQWRVIDMGGGQFRFQSVFSGKCLDVTGVSTADGAAMQQWDCYDVGNQKFRLVSAPGPDGTTGGTTGGASCAYADWQAGKAYATGDIVRYPADGGFDLGLPLQSDPDLISRDGKVAWQTGLWFWMTQSGAGYRSGHASMVGGNGFGETIRSLNGSLECNGGNPGQVQSRVDAYRRFCRLLGVDPGANLGC
jgi:hypothetical protein